MTQTVGGAHPNPPTIPAIENLTRRQRRFEKPMRSQRLTAAWLIAPAAVLGVTFLLIPIALAFALAFTNAKLVSPQGPQFVGFDNFTRLFNDPVFWKSLRNTILFAVFVVPIQAGFALFLALLINVKVKGVNFFRTVYFLPVVTSMVVISMLWLFMYRPDGLINALLSNGRHHRPGLAGQPQHRAGRDPVHVSLAGCRVPHGDLAVGPADHLAGHVRGVVHRRGQQLAELPVHHLARPAADQNLHPDHHHDLRVQPVHPGAGDDPGRTLDATTTVVYQAVRAGYAQQQTGYASAISLVFFVLVLAVSLVQRYLTRDKDVQK